MPAAQKDENKSKNLSSKAKLFKKNDRSTKEKGSEVRKVSNLSSEQKY